MYYSPKDIPYLSSLKYKLDPIGECTFNGLANFHRQNVGNDYPFWEWFNDHISWGIIEILR